MTADEIRAEVRENAQRFNVPGGTPYDVLIILLYSMAAEIAAQLAELNSNMRTANGWFENSDYYRDGQP